MFVTTGVAILIIWIAVINIVAPCSEQCDSLSPVKGKKKIEIKLMTQMKYELKIQMKILILWLVVKNIWIPYTHTHTHMQRAIKIESIE